GPSVPAVVVVFGVCYVLPAFLHTVTPFAAGLAALMLVWWLDGREEIEIDCGRVTLSRSAVGLRRTREIARRDIGAIDGAGLRLVGGRAVALGRNLGHRRESLDWLARRLARASGIGGGST